MTDKVEESTSVEAILEELASIADELETRDLSLDKALALFERGVKLSAQGSRRLDEAEKKLEVLLEDGERAEHSLEDA